MQGLAGFMTSLDQGGDVFVKCPKNIKKAEGGLEAGKKKLVVSFFQWTMQSSVFSSRLIFLWKLVGN